MRFTLPRTISGKPFSAFGLSIMLGAVAASALAQDNPAIAQRQGQFNLYAHNFAVLGGMAQGRVDYDAELAQVAADNLFHVSRHDQSRLWPQGTDSTSAEGTRASPAIWDNLDDFADKFVALQDAAVSMQDAAGNGIDALRPAVGALGATCRACHESYRDEES